MQRPGGTVLRLRRLGRRGLPVLVGVEILDKLRDGALDALELLTCQNAARGVVDRELKTFQGDLVVIRREGALLQKLLGMLLRLVGVAGQHALVKILDRR